MLDLTFDLKYQDEYGIVCGIDEAGRGPLAGPVAAGACVLPRGAVIEGLDDSKKLTEKKREALYEKIVQTALFWGVGLADEGEIDRINILESTFLAMRRAVENSGARPDLLLIDRDPGLPHATECVVKGDGISQSIAAASVLAKVTRDRIMKDLDREYPCYGFARHMGYPTPEHKLAVFVNGPCPRHRRSFLSFLEKDREKLARAAAEAQEGKK